MDVMRTCPSLLKINENYLVGVNHILNNLSRDSLEKFRHRIGFF
jgi:hypothetical protein